MTCIIAVRDKKNKVWLAGDKMASNGVSHYLVKDPKVFQVGDFYFGFTDSFYMGQLLKYSFVPPERQEGISDSQYLFQDVRVANNQLDDPFSEDKIRTITQSIVTFLYDMSKRRGKLGTYCCLDLVSYMNQVPEPDIIIQYVDQCMRIRY